MNIAEYSPAHKDACIKMFLSNTPVFFAPEELPQFESWLDDLARGEGRKGADIYNFVVIDDNVPVACGGFYVQSSVSRAHMAWGMVHGAYHKKGIGRELLSFRVRRIREVFPQCDIVLDTTQFSKGFYERMGFVTTKVTSDFYAPGMDRYDMELGAENGSL